MRILCAKYVRLVFVLLWVQKYFDVGLLCYYRPMLRSVLRGGLTMHMSIPAVVVGFLFISSGLGKLFSLNEFVTALSGYRWIKRFFTVWFLARFIAISEVGIGAALLVGPWSRPAGFAGLLLLIAFTTVVALTLLRADRPASCGCKLLLHSEKMSWVICFRNLGLAALLLPNLWPTTRLWFGILGSVILVTSLALSDLDFLRTRAVGPHH